MKAKRIAALVLAGVLCALALTGCGIDKDAAIATMKGKEVTMGIANFYCRYQQSCVEDYYKSMMGSSGDIWAQDVYGNGTTLEDSMKESVMEMLHEMYTLEAHMGDYNISLTDSEKSAITEAAKKFMDGNASDTLKEMGASQELVEEYLTLMTVRTKMVAAIEAEADTNVSDEEANKRGYSMVKIETTGTTDESGSQVEYTEEEKAELTEKADAMEEKLQTEDTKLEDVAKEYGYEVTTGSYASDDSALDEAVKKALDGLKEGETSGKVETEDAIYFLRLDAETDKEATEQNREAIINQRKSDLYQETLEGWQKDDNWKVDEDMLEKIQFKNSFTQQDPNASTQTEGAESTQ